MSKRLKPISEIFDSKTKDRNVIEQRKLATLWNLREAAKILTVELKEMEIAGFAVEPGPLNFMQGKLLLYSPVPAPPLGPHGETIRDFLN